MNTDKHSIFIYFAVVVFLMFSGCAKTVRVGKPFIETELPFFDDGIDVLTDYSVLSGTYGFEAREELDGRCNLADVIAVVTILSVQSTDENGDNEELIVEVQVDQVIYGQAVFPQIRLNSKSSALGHMLMKRHESELTGTKLLFLRTFPVEGGNEAIGNHFHLSPNSVSTLQEVRRYVRKRSDAESKSNDKK